MSCSRKNADCPQASLDLLRHFLRSNNPKLQSSSKYIQIRNDAGIHEQSNHTPEAQAALRLLQIYGTGALPNDKKTEISNEE